MSSDDCSTVSIIGSAGRKEEMKLVNKELMESARNAILQTITEEWKLEPAQVRLVSGGAAVIDHLAVRLFLDKSLKWHSIHLHLPCKFDTTRMEYDRTDKTGWYSNSLHRQFTERVNPSSLCELSRLVKEFNKGNTQIQVDYHSGFLKRNVPVSASHYILALTFGDDAAPKQESGTFHTWRLAEANGISQLKHVSLKSFIK